MTSDDGKIYSCTVSGVFLSSNNAYSYALTDNDEAQGSADMFVEVYYEGQYDIVFTYNAETKEITVTPNIQKYCVAFAVGNEVLAGCYKYMTIDEITEFIDAGKSPDCATIDIPQGSTLIWAKDATLSIGQLTLKALQYAPADGFAIGEEIDEQTKTKRIKYAKFSHGNLQYSNEAGYKFAVHQYDMIGSDNETYYRNHGESYKTIDLFSWVSAPNLCSISEFYGPRLEFLNENERPVIVRFDLTGPFAFMDRGVYNRIGSDPAGTWRTMTADEWNYLLTGRDNAANLSGLATITDDSGEEIYGMVLLPDNCTEFLGGLTFTPFGQISKYEKSEGMYCDGFPQDYGYSSNKYTAYDWSYIEESGAIFLPAAGYVENTTSGQWSRPTYLGPQRGYYWSTTVGSNQGHYVEFQSDFYYSDKHKADYSDRFSVRLIQDYESTLGQSSPITYVFKTSDDSYVEFTKGNLVKTGDTYSFAASPFEPGTYFEWNGTDFGRALTNETDWGANTINGEPGGTYRTLSFEEWNYLLSRDEKGMQATINVTMSKWPYSSDICSITGYIILPENWVEPEGLGVELTYDNQSSFADNTLTILQWYLMEQAGAVFLPAVGRITDGSDDNVLYNGEYAYYWSASNYGYQPVADAQFTLYAPAPLSITDGNIGQLQLTAGDNGFAKLPVRLVKDYSPQAHQGYAVRGENDWFGEEVILEKNSIGVYTTTVPNLNLSAGTYNYTLSYNGEDVQSASLTIDYDGIYNILFGYYDDKLSSKIHVVKYDVVFEIADETVPDCHNYMDKEQINTFIENGSIPCNLNLDVPASASLVWEQDKETTTGKYTLKGSLQFEQNDIDYYFTVSGDARRVQFAKGNLASRFTFTENQYDFGAYFAWNGEDMGTSLTDATDWGAMQINGENSGTYRTLTEEEWAYLTATRQNRGMWATINVNDQRSVEGYILLPDNWTEPQDLGLTLNMSSPGANANQLTLFQWLAMENVGAIFLPAAKKKIGGVMASGYYCVYWSSTSNGSYPYILHISTTKTGGGYIKSADETMPVRLVKDYDENTSSQPIQQEDKLYYFAISNIGKNSDYVQFAKGNLLTDYTFAAEQYLPGDYFTSPDDSQQALDIIAEWPTNKEINGEEAGTYRLLTNAEWDYVFGRTGDDVPNLSMQATINVDAATQVNGFILLPENWVEPTNLDYQLSYNNNSYFSDNQLTLSQWKLMENAGAVFLPAAGRKEHFGSDEVTNANSEGFYWSSSYKQSGNNYIPDPVKFESGAYSDAGLAVNQIIYAALSVRLVKAHNTNFSKPKKDYYFAVSDNLYVQFSKTNISDTYISYQYNKGGYYNWPKSIDVEAPDCADWSACHLEGGYRLLSADEWSYLLNRDEKGMQGAIQVSDNLTQNGFILLPEEWEEPSDLSVELTYNNLSAFSDNILSWTDWIKMENAGAIFLPAAGSKNVVSGAMFLENEICNYWTASVDLPSQDTKAVYVTIEDKNFNVTNAEMRPNNQIGRSLRFVVDY